jgi:hypothetical protein
MPVPWEINFKPPSYGFLFFINLKLNDYNQWSIINSLWVNHFCSFLEEFYIFFISIGYCIKLHPAIAYTVKCLIDVKRNHPNQGRIQDFKLGGHT